MPESRDVIRLQKGDRLLEAREIAALLGVSRRTVWRYAQHEAFPEPFFAGTQKRLWLKSEVEKWAAEALPLPKPGRPPKSRKSG